MHTYQYIGIPLNYSTVEIRREYNIMNVVKNAYVYIEIRKGIYEIKEADILVFNYTKKHIAPHGYHPVRYTAGLWKHKTRKQHLFFVPSILRSNKIKIKTQRLVVMQTPVRGFNRRSCRKRHVGPMELLLT